MKYRYVFYMCVFAILIFLGACAYESDVPAETPDWSDVGLRLDRLESRLDRVDRRLSDVESRLGKAYGSTLPSQDMESRLRDLEWRRLRNIEQELEKLKERLEDLEWMLEEIRY